VVFDSLTALARAYHTSTNPSSRVLEHGLDASTVHSVKQGFGAGRNIENGGSLTLIATGARGTDAGDFVLAELETTANAHVTLEQGDLEARVDPLRTYTRNLDAIFDVDELAPRIVLRRLLEERGSQDGAAWLEEQLGCKSASQCLSASVKVTPREKAEIRRSFARAATSSAAPNRFLTNTSRSSSSSPTRVCTPTRPRPAPSGAATPSSAGSCAPTRSGRAPRRTRPTPPNSRPKTRISPRNSRRCNSGPRKQRPTCARCLFPATPTTAAMSSSRSKQAKE